MLLHVLILLAFSLAFMLKPEEKQKPPHFYVPSFVYKGAITPTVQQQSSKSKQVRQSSTKTDLALKSNQEKTIPVTKKKIEQSILATSLATLQQNQFKAMSEPTTTDPILLIGDENTFADPIVKLLGRSLSAHFKYPDAEGMLGIKGRVIVEMILHPQGQFTDIRMVKSSYNENLDAAALYAVNSAPLVEGADRFLTKPTKFVVGFVFH